MKKFRYSKYFLPALLAPILLMLCFSHARADEAGDAFLNAKQSTYEEKWGDAIKYFEGFLEQYPDSDLLDDAIFWLGFSLIKNGNADCGITVLNTFFADEPSFLFDGDSHLECKDTKLKLDVNTKNASNLPNARLLKGYDCEKVVLKYAEAFRNGSDVPIENKDIKLDCARVVTEREETFDSGIKSGENVTTTGFNCDEFTYKYSGTDAELGGNGNATVCQGLTMKPDKKSGDQPLFNSNPAHKEPDCASSLALNCASTGILFVNKNGMNTRDLMLSKYADDALYYKGLAYMNKKDFESGIAVFKKLVKVFNNSMWAPEALSNAVEYYTGAGDYKSALPVYEIFLKRFPDDSRIDEMKTGYCVALQKAGMADACDAFLKKLKNKKDDYIDSVAAEIIRIYRENESGAPVARPVFSNPLCGKSYRVISNFGFRVQSRAGASSNHLGIDMIAPDFPSGNFEICAAAEGEVIFAGSKRGYGNTVIIRHNSAFSTLYAHGSKIMVETGRKVRRGDTIMLAGSTGISTGNHLHFEVRRYGIVADPMEYIENYKDAVELHLNGKIGAAVDKYIEAIEGNPTVASYYTDLGEAYRVLGKSEMAIIFLKRAIELDPKMANAYTSLGVIYETKGAADKAIEYHKKAIAADPDHAIAYNNLGHAYQSAGKMKEAEKSYRKAMETDRKFAPSYDNLGALLMSLGRPDEGMEMINKAIEISSSGDPMLGLYYNDLGAAYVLKKDYKAACEALEKAHGLLPNNPDINRNLENTSKFCGE